jgi:hypothetical protein
MLVFWFENKPSGNPGPPKFTQNVVFLFENKPSGNPGLDARISWLEWI